MKYFRAFRVAALFVGAVVGAGFATGQEVRLFFGESGALDLLLASAFMALCAFVFMDMGRGEKRDGALYLCADSVITLSSFAVYAAMIAAAERVTWEMTGQRGLSLFLAFFVACFSGKRASRLSLLNAFAVPLMTGIVVLVGVRYGGEITGGTHPIRAFAYGGMNLLFSGALMSKEGEGLSLSERRIASILAGAMIFALLFFMRRAVSAKGGGEMPFLEVASRGGFGLVASISLLLAILTTMAGCAYLVTERMTLLTQDGLFSASFVTLAGVLLSKVGFGVLVRTTYPLVSCFGLLATVSVLGKRLQGRLFARYGKRRLAKEKRER